MLSRQQPNLPNLKAEARRYRAAKQIHGYEVSHSRALELVARRHGFFDWNTAAAHGKSIPAPREFPAGTHVRGRYLGHEFEGRVVSSAQLSIDEVQISLELWVPVDVVASDRFSAFRKRVSGIIGPDGCSREHLSNGVPQLELFSGRGELT